ncbi:MAG TPA: mandelate racemase/muconate lactonizing enzyme family protein [Paludibaculum sp.]|jgi:L-alanine-DL-glutamate epimerase-like enolase superfamily enzyme
MIRRRDILAAAPAALASNSASLAAPGPELGTKLAAAMAAPVLNRALFSAAVPIESVQLLKSGPHYFVRARSRDGVCGYADAHSSVMSAAYPIVVKKVAPFFRGKNAVDLESLLREVYVANSNYKWQGLPFWVSVAVVEIAILDMLGKVAGKPLGELIGKVQRHQIAVYRASGNRGNSPEAEIEYLQKIVAETGASAVKFRLGARMAYDDASTRRDLAMIPLTRKVFGDRMAIYADGNGSYDVPIAIRIGRIMEQHKFAFFEEPAPFDYYEETKAIADALDIRVALGEEEASLRGFRSIIEHGVAQVIQPDILYSGGLIRAVKVARMAAIAGLECTVHMSGGGLGFLYVAHFASCIPNPGPHQEYKGADDTLPVSSDTSSLQCEKGLLQVPTGPGLGVTLEPQFLNKAAAVTA